MFLCYEDIPPQSRKTYLGIFSGLYIDHIYCFIEWQAYQIQDLQNKLFCLQTLYGQPVIDSFIAPPPCCQPPPLPQVLPQYNPEIFYHPLPPNQTPTPSKRYTQSKKEKNQEKQHKNAKIEKQKTKNESKELDKVLKQLQKDEIKNKIDKLNDTYFKKENKSNKEYKENCQKQKEMKTHDKKLNTNDIQNTLNSSNEDKNNKEDKPAIHTHETNNMQDIINNQKTKDLHNTILPNKPNTSVKLINKGSTVKKYNDKSKLTKKYEDGQILNESKEIKQVEKKGIKYLNKIKESTNKLKEWDAESCVLNLSNFNLTYDFPPLPTGNTTQEKKIVKPVKRKNSKLSSLKQVLDKYKSKTSNTKINDVNNIDNISKKPIIPKKIKLVSKKKRGPMKNSLYYKPICYNSVNNKLNILK